MFKSPDYRLTSPCHNCPFRNDIRPYLRPERVDEIEACLDRGEFPCHKTAAAAAEEDNDRPVPDRPSHCAGSLILLEKLNRASQMMRIAERVNLYDRTQLNMDAPVFDSFEEMRQAMVREERKTKRRSRTKSKPKKHDES